MLMDLSVPRLYVPLSLDKVQTSEVHIFSDASEQAIAAVAYIKTTEVSGQGHTGFIFGKAKVAPSKGHTIPRLELCGAGLATEIAEIISRNLNLSLDNFKYYIDSRVILGYINNKSRRFYTYVTNRVEKILRVSSSDQWKYISTHLNSADTGTRCMTSNVDTRLNFWLHGPEWLKKCTDNVIPEEDGFTLVEPELDKEVRPEVTTKKCRVAPSNNIVTKRCERYSSWRSLVPSISYLMHVAHSFANPNEQCQGWHKCDKHRSVDMSKRSESFIIQEVQRECFKDEVDRLTKRKSIATNSSLLSLTSIMDEDGILRVGGRLNRGKHLFPESEVNPIILPKGHHVTTLLVRHYDSLVEHWLGRHFSEGALRSAGFWIIGAKRFISSFIYNCVTCIRLRRKSEYQVMVDLPTDRISPGPPFTSLGVDAFGPWKILSRRTRARGGLAESERWAILFTCLTTRAVHIEVVEEMSSSSFINALRRFVSLRGPVKLIGQRNKFHWMHG